jgi:hypothetical protein
MKHIKLKFGSPQDMYRYNLERLSDGHKDWVAGFKDGLLGSKVIDVIQMVEERFWNL